MRVVISKALSEVEAKWTPPAGFFDQPAEKLAHALLKDSSSPVQAMQRLVFYINRAGKNLKAADLSRLNQAKALIHKVHTSKGS